MNNTNSLGVVLPALNEEKSLEKVVMGLVKCLTELEVNYNLIIVNDGSTDNTRNIADNLSKKNEHIQVIHNEKPQNIGKCYQQGIKVLNTDYITWLPTDGEINPSVLKCMWPHVSQNSIVIPYPDSGLEERTYFRRLLSRLYQSFFSCFFKINLNYFNGNSIIPKNRINTHQLFSTGFTVNAEIILYGIKVLNLTPIEIPFNLEKRDGGVQKAISLKNLLNILKSVFELGKIYNV